MDKYISRFYGIWLLVILFIVISLFGVFYYFNTYMEEEAQRDLALKNEYLAASIDAELQQKAQIVDDASVYIQQQGIQDEEQLLRYLKAILAESENLESIYFGTAENRMVNGSGWQPPDDFDLRTRPWYTEAIEQKGLIFTDVFLNASRDKQIITISKPIYDQQKNLVGVVGADLAISKIIELIQNQKGESGYAFLLDGRLQVVAYSERLENVADRLQDISAELSGSQSRENQDGVWTEIDGMEGYALVTKVKGMDFTLGTFIPEKVYSSYHNQWLYILWPTLLVVMILFTIIFFLERKILLRPLILLDKDIQKISIRDDSSYRLPSLEKDPYGWIRESANSALAETEKVLSELQDKKDELEASNDELTAAFNQLQAYEEVLKQHNARLTESKLLLEDSEKRNQAIISVLPDILFVYDGNGTFLDCQTNDRTNLLLSKDQFIGKTLSEVMPPEIAEKGLSCIREVLAAEDVRRFDYQMEVDGKVRFYETRMVKSRENQVLAIVRDITLEKKEQDVILELSYKDHLTGLYNRRYFDETLILMDDASHLPLAIMMIDVNGLKLTNDAFGHGAGDELLRKVAEVLQANCPPEGFVSRVGGDEFVMVCPDTDRQKAEEIGLRIYDDIGKKKLDSIVISVSAGWEVRESLEQTVRDTFIKAENHMFRKKIVESQSMRNKTIQVIMETLNEKSEREKRHSVQVSEWSRKIGEAMAMNSQFLKELETAGLVHDIGKIAIREEVLNKPDRLSQEEYDEIKKHAESGYQILKSVDAYSSLAEDVLAHHERFDGKGYPRGLKGEEIPIIARIIAVADAYEAMISDRPYRKGMSHQQAENEILRCSGTQFDPAIAEAFVRIFNR